MTMNSRTKPLILIVEDNEINSQVLVEYLSNDYDVIVAADGLEAIEIIQKNLHDISLILLDLILPSLDGFELLEEMNENGWIQFVPVVIISSEGSEEFQQRAYLNNVYAFITKPFTYKEVMSCVKAIVS